MLQHHLLFPTVVSTAQLLIDPLQQAIVLKALLALRGDAEGNPSDGCAWTGDLHGVWQLHRHPSFSALAQQVALHAKTYLDVLPNADPDELRCSISFDFVLTAPEQGGSPEYLAPHPSQWASQ